MMQKKKLENALDEGDCPTILKDGDSCAQKGVGNYSCSSTCGRGVLDPASCNFDYNNEFKKACETIPEEAFHSLKGNDLWDDDYTGDGVTYRHLFRYKRDKKYTTSNSNKFFVGPQRIGGVLVYALTADGEIRPQIRCESNDPPSPVADDAPTNTEKRDAEATERAQKKKQLKTSHKPEDCIAYMDFFKHEGTQRLKEYCCRNKNCKYLFNEMTGSQCRKKDQNTEQESEC